MHSPLRRAGVLLLAAGVAVACGPTVSPSPTATPSPSATPAASEPSPVPSQDVEAIYRDIEAAVVRIRGLEAIEDVEPQILTEDELRERTAASFEEDNPAELIAASEILYKALGMFEKDQSLRDLYLELLGDQVAGFYDPEVDELFVVARSGGLGVEEQITYAHEFTHALQDQHFDLEEIGIADPDDGDRSFAVRSLVEGDATAAMFLWGQSALTAEQWAQMLAAGLEPGSTEVLTRMPPILRESLLFPYQSGLQLVLGLQFSGGFAAVDDAYTNLPASTEQVIHPEKYFSGEAPIDVPLPDDLAGGMGAGWQVTYEDTFGEFQFGVWLRNAIGQADTGNAAAAGWGGDRFAVLQGPDDAWALVMHTEWDSAAEADEFEQVASQALERATGPAEVLPGEGGTVRWVVVASDDETLGRAANAAGLAG